MTISPSASSSATRHGRLPTHVRWQAGGAKARFNSRPIVGRSKIQTCEIDSRRLSGCGRGAHRRANRQAAISHVREYEHVVHFRQQPNLTRGFDVRDHTARQRQMSLSGQAHGIPRKRDDDMFDGSLRQIRELFVGEPPVHARERRAEGMSRPLGFDHAILHTHPRQQRIVGVGDWRRIVRQRHHLAFVFELAHVEQVRDVLEEHADRVARGRCGEPRTAGRQRRSRSSRTARRRVRRSSGQRTSSKPDAQAAPLHAPRDDRRCGASHDLNPRRSSCCLNTTRADRPGDGTRRPLGHPVLHRARQTGQRTRRGLSSAHGVVAFLAPGPQAPEGLRRIAGCGRDDVDAVRTKSAVRKTGVD